MRHPVHIWSFFQHELLVDKYSKEMSVGDILEMYPDPEDYFGKLDRKVTDLYKKLSLAHLKREFRQIMSTPITQVCLLSAVLPLINV